MLVSRPSWIMKWNWSLVSCNVTGFERLSCHLHWGSGMLLFVACYAFNGLTKFLHGICLACAGLSCDTRDVAQPSHWSSVDAPMHIPMQIHRIQFPTHTQSGFILVI